LDEVLPVYQLPAICERFGTSHAGSGLIASRKLTSWAALGVSLNPRVGDSDGVLVARGTNCHQRRLVGVKMPDTANGVLISTENVTAKVALVELLVHALWSKKARPTKVSCFRHNPIISRLLRVGVGGWWRGGVKSL